jgi:hypothetical protein
MNTEDGGIVTSHPKNAALLWEEFKKRLGDSIQIEMHFNLQNLVVAHDVEQLDELFTKQDIDLIVKNMPSDRPLVTL